MSCFSHSVNMTSNDNKLILFWFSILLGSLYLLHIVLYVSVLLFSYLIYICEILSALFNFCSTCMIVVSLRYKRNTSQICFEIFLLQVSVVGQSTLRDAETRLEIAKKILKLDTLHLYVVGNHETSMCFYEAHDNCYYYSYTCKIARNYR